MFRRSLIFLLFVSSAFAQTKTKEGVQTTGALPTAQGGAPAGGTTGQVIQKNTAADYDYSWGTIVTTNGTVTSFSAGDLSPLFTTTETNPTTTPALSFVLSTAGANTVFGNASNTTGAPVYSSSPRFTAIGNLTTNGFVKTGGGVGTLSVDTNSYLTGNQTVTLTGDVAGSGATAITTSYNNVVPTGKGGVPSGGTTGQALTKIDNTNYNTQWTTLGAGSGTVTSITATAPIVVTPTPLTTTGVISITGSALTKTDDTNVTLTLGGTPSTALLGATSITAGWTGTLAVGRGGTGAATAGANTVFGNNTGVTAAPVFSSSPQFTAIGNLTTNGFVKTGGGVGTLSVDTNTYLTGNQSISLTGDVTGSGTTSIAATIPNSTVTYAKMQNVSANSKLLGSNATGSGAPPSELTLGTNLSMSGSTLNATGGVTVANPGSQLLGLTAINGSAATALRSDGAMALDQSIAPTWIGAHAWKLSDAVTNTTTNILTLGHNSSGSVAANFGDRILFQAKDAVGNDSDQGYLTTQWTTATGGSQVSYMDFGLRATIAGVQSGMRLFQHNGSVGGLNVGGTGDPGAGFISASAGYLVGGAGSTSGKVLQSDGSKFLASTPTYPLTAGTSGNVLTSDGTNFLSSAPGYPAGGSMTKIGNVDYTILSTDKIVATNAAFTALHTWTMPAASTVGAGKSISLIDLQSTLTATNRMLIVRSSTDVFQPGAQTQINLTQAGQGIQFTSDGVSNWYTTYFSPPGGFGNGTLMVFDNSNKSWVANANAPFLVSSPATGTVVAWNGSAWAQSAYTMPSGGTSGKVITGNGLNYVESTPTFPTLSSSTSGKIIKSDGTNWLASTETYAAPGTAGNILRSDGTNWIQSTDMPTGGVAGQSLVKASSTNYNTSWGLLDLANASTTTQAPSTSDFYLAGSNIPVGANNWAGGGQYKCRFEITKTAASVAVWTVNVRVGTAGSIADTAIITLTGPTQTAVVDVMTVDLNVNIRTNGATATSAANYIVIHTAANGAGYSLSAPILVGALSQAATFNSTTATTIGVSFNGGASHSGSVTVVQAQYMQ